MPTFVHGDVELNYLEAGEGFPVLLLAPGGLRSTIDFWSKTPWNPIEHLAGRYRVIAMDQRNAGASRGPVTADSGWGTYTADQLALLDHLGVDRFHAIGMCIGGPFVMGLIEAVPDRVTSGVLMQTIGVDDNRQVFYEIFDKWVETQRDQHPETDDRAWAAFREAMFGGDFLFNVSRDFVAGVSTPLLVLMGDDIHHPKSASLAVAELAPDVEFIQQWKDGDDRAAAMTAIEDFLAAHTPTP